MAKISARGAHEVARFTASRPGSPHTAQYLLRSDGVVLIKLNGIEGEGWKHWTRKLGKATQKTANELLILLNDAGLEIVR